MVNNSAIDLWSTDKTKLIWVQIVAIIAVSGNDRLVMDKLDLIGFVASYNMRLDYAVNSQIVWSGPFLSSVIIRGDGFMPVTAGGKLTDVNGGFIQQILATEGFNTLELTNLSLTAEDFFDLQFAGSARKALTMVLNGSDQVFGTVSRDKLLAGAGADQLVGYGGNDTLRGGIGQDTLFGNQGNDVLYGGKGSDVFVFNVNPTKAGVDSLRDFKHGQDLIALDNNDFSNLGATGLMALGRFTLNTQATTAKHAVIYDQATGRIWADGDGTGPINQVLFATVAPGSVLTASDFLVY